MSHYLTQPEEIDYILMTEEQDTEADRPLSTQSAQQTANNAQFARVAQNSLPANN